MDSTLASKSTRLATKVGAVKPLWLLVWATCIVVILAALSLSLWLGRGDWIYPTQPQASQIVAAPLTQQTEIGQSFVAEQAGLQGIGLKLHLPAGEPNRQLTLRLYQEVGATAPLRQATASTAGQQDGAFIYFEFDPIADSRHVYYYLTLTADTPPAAPGPMLYGAALSSYPNGSAYANGAPVDAQLTFQLNYNRPAMALDTARRLGGSIPETLIALLFLLLPGAVLLVWLAIPLKLEGVEWAALATGLSLSLYVILLSWLRYLPFRLSGLAVWLIFLGLGMLLLWGLWRKRPVFGPAFGLWRQQWRLTPAFVGLAGVLALSWLARIAVIQGVEVPLWADSYHHTMISQLIVDQGRVPNSWQPYAPLESLSYHYGFHVMVAVFHWLTGRPVIGSVLVVGQLLNFLTVLMAYAVGRRLGGNAWVGLFAALITGLLSQYPMFYVNWGRYTQLAGQVILPALVAGTYLLLAADHRDRRLIGVNLLLAAGLFLTHYRVVLFYPAFVLALIMVRWVQVSFRRSTIIEDTVRLAGIGIGALVLVSPRLIELVGSKLWQVNVNVARQGMASEYTRQVHNALLNILEYVPPLIFILAWMGLILASWRRNTGLAAFGLWWGLLLLLANPHFIGLPGAGVITNFAIYIGAYMVFAVLAAYVLGQLCQALSVRKAALGWLLLPLIAAIAIWGARKQLPILDTSGQLVTRPDWQAMTWITENVPDDARFLVNSRLSYGGWVVAGTDGGWWMPLITGRQNTAPPMLYLMEAQAESDFPTEIRDLFLEFHMPDLTAVEFAHRMAEHNLDYIYIGQQRGRVWQGDEIPLDPDLFAASPDFDLIYAQNGVRIFRLISTAS